MKKDGIQTRNRKLSTKSKKKRGSVVDFFSSPFDCKSFSSAYSVMGGGGVHSGVHGGGSGGHHGYLANGGYYGQVSSQFAPAVHHHTSMYAAPGTGLSGLHQAVSAAVAATTSSPSPPAAVAEAAAASAATGTSAPQPQQQQPQQPPSPLLTAAAAAASASAAAAFGLGPHQTVAMT